MDNGDVCNKLGVWLVTQIIHFDFKALCEIGEAAEFKLAFYELQPELQAEIHKYLRQNYVRQLLLEQLFAIVQDAEVGLAGQRSWQYGQLYNEGGALIGRHFNPSKREISIVVNAFLPENGQNNID